MPNPTGKGGFGDHPENKSDGRWDKENSYSYWLNFFKSLSFDKFKKYKDETGESNMSMACLAAYARVAKTIGDLSEFQEVANRTEGKSHQKIEIETPDSIEVKKKTEKLDKILKELQDKNAKARKDKIKSGK